MKLSSGFYRNTKSSEIFLNGLSSIDRDQVINGGEINSDNILYRNLTLKGNDYTTEGKIVDIKALENIIMDLTLGLCPHRPKMQRLDD